MGRSDRPVERRAFFHQQHRSDHIALDSTCAPDLKLRSSNQVALKLAVHHAYADIDLRFKLTRFAYYQSTALRVQLPVHLAINLKPICECNIAHHFNAATYPAEV